MRDYMIAGIVLIVIATGLFLMFHGKRSQHVKDVEQQAILDLNECRANIYNNPVYASIKSHLPSPDNQFVATDIQLAESSMPAEAERKLLATYQTDLTACKTAALAKFEKVDPPMAVVLKDKMEKSNEILQKLIDGKMSWGESAQQMDNLRK